MRKPLKKFQILLLDLLLFIVLVAADRITKFFAIKHLSDGSPYKIFSDILELQYLENTGAAFGMLQDQKYFFIFVAFIFIVLILYVLCIIPAHTKYRILHIWLVIIAAGAAGNMIDRIRLDFVVDFIYLKLIHFPIFNVADIFVTLGTIGVIFSIIFKYKEKDFAFLNFKQTKYREVK